MNDSGIHFGVDYYPEHWPRQRWETDARLMKELGIQVVRMAEFSWHKMEPNEGQYDFVWLEEAVELLGKYGIKSVLGTPSAAPPAWMIHQHPEILPIDKQGRTRGFGGRHHDCQSNHTYRRYVADMVTAMAKQFAENPNIIGWQIDNEFGNGHGDLCMCDSCKTSFQGWLKKKYDTVDSLNLAWGTHFWSQEYNSFDEVCAPKITVTGENPSAMLDWRCFCSDLIVDFQQKQIDIIRTYCSNHFITHNCMGFSDKVNYYDLGKNLDFMSHDQYPGLFCSTMPIEENFNVAASLDLIRGIKKRSFWIMEQQSGLTGWETMGRTPHPGQLSAWAAQSVAHGADCVVFFRWRTCTVGTEQYWHGILPHSGNPGRRYEEFKLLIHKLGPHMDAMEGSVPRSEVALVFSYRQGYALQIQPHHPQMSYDRQIKKYYKDLYQRNIPVDFIEDSDDFSQYKLVIAPLQYLMTPELEQKYIDYVAGGGHLILTMRTGVKDAHNICMSDRELPGRLGDLCGIEILDYDCLRETNVKIQWLQEKLMEIDQANATKKFKDTDLVNTAEKLMEYFGEKWADIITLNGAESMAEYASEFYTGSPCITQNSYGKGKVYYVGTEPADALMEQFLTAVIEGAGVTSLGWSEGEIELSIREKDEKKWLFVINYGRESGAYEVPEGYEKVIGEECGRIEGFGIHLYVKR